MKSRKPVLLAEDDEIDVLSVKRAFNELQIKNPLIIAGNGEDALEYLVNPINILPCLILLDIKMPKMDGLEFLRVIKNDLKLKKIPVIILTTSNNERDLSESFNLSVAGYMVKPIDNARFIDTIKIIDVYWTLSELPED